MFKKFETPKFVKYEDLYHINHFIDEINGNNIFVEHFI